MVVSLITRALSKAKPVKDTIKVYRGEVAKELQKPNYTRKDFYKENKFYESMDRDSMGDRFDEINAKRQLTQGRWFSSNEGSARSYADKKKGRLLEAEISKKDFKLGQKINKKFFKGVAASDNPQTIILPKKNLKDVKENIDFYKDKVGTFAATEYKKGGMIDMTKDKKYYKGVL